MRPGIRRHPERRKFPAMIHIGRAVMGTLKAKCRIMSANGPRSTKARTTNRPMPGACVRMPPHAGATGTGACTICVICLTTTRRRSIMALGVTAERTTIRTAILSVCCLVTARTELVCPTGSIAVRFAGGLVSTELAPTPGVSPARFIATSPERTSGTGARAVRTWRTIFMPASAAHGLTIFLFTGRGWLSPLAIVFFFFFRFVFMVFMVMPGHDRCKAERHRPEHETGLQQNLSNSAFHASPRF